MNTSINLSVYGICLWPPLPTFTGEGRGESVGGHIPCNVQHKYGEMHLLIKD